VCTLWAIILRRTRLVPEPGRTEARRHTPWRSRIVPVAAVPVAAVAVLGVTVLGATAVRVAGAAGALAAQGSGGGGDGVTGSFVQVNGADGATVVEQAAAAGLDHVVVQASAVTYVGDDGATLADEHGALACSYFVPREGFEASPFSYRCADGDVVGDLLAAARARGIRVWLGLNASESPDLSESDWFLRVESGVPLPEPYLVGVPGDPGRPGLAGWAIRTADALVRRFPEAFADGTVAGFYLHPELENVDFRMGGARERRNLELYIAYLRAVRAGVDTLQVVHGLPQPVRLMISPFVNESLHPEPGEWAATIAAVVGGAVVAGTGRGVDVVALQDGLGPERFPDPVTGASQDHTSLATVQTWLLATRAGIDAAAAGRTELWANVETYREVAHHQFVAADPAEIERQIALAAPVVDRVTTYSLLHYQLGS
jgi:hypothetical protein